MVTAYIGLGSNLNDPVSQVLKAWGELKSLPKTTVTNFSGLYGSRPLILEGRGDHSDQPDYVNAAAELETGLEPESLFDHLQAIETLHHRKRSQKWQARTLDLDLLLYNQQQIRTDRLTVPHQEISNRAFVLFPLAEIAPALVIPGQGMISRLVVACSANDCWLLPQG